VLCLDPKLRKKKKHDIAVPVRYSQIILSLGVAYFKLLTGSLNKC